MHIYIYTPRNRAPRDLAIGSKLHTAESLLLPPAPVSLARAPKPESYGSSSRSPEEALD